MSGVKKLVIDTDYGYIKIKSACIPALGDRVFSVKFDYDGYHAIMVFRYVFSNNRLGSDTIIAKRCELAGNGISVSCGDIPRLTNSLIECTDVLLSAISPEYFTDDEYITKSGRKIKSTKKSYKKALLGIYDEKSNIISDMIDSIADTTK